MKKRILAALLCAGLVTFAPAGTMAQTPVGGVFSQTVSAANIENVTYLDENGQEQITSATVIDSDYTWSDNYALSSGTYLVHGEVEVGSRINIEGNVMLILGNNCNLNATQGISVNEGNSLTITAQSEDEEEMGRLTVQNAPDAHAGIGGYLYSAGTITINGGIIKAQGGSYSAGIGCGSGHNCGTIIINGGSVTATGGYFGSGIGNGYGGSSGTIKISGGSINATGSQYASGIGGGFTGGTQTIEISGGVVTAIGGYWAAGIGCGYYGTRGSVTISGGTVHAFSGWSGSGNAIGNGDNSSGATFSTGINGNAVIYATLKNQGNQPIVGMDTDSWSGIFFFNSSTEGNESTAGTVYGDVSLADDYTIEATQTVTIPENMVLVVPEGVTLTVNGELIVEGKLIVNDTLINNGTISGSGTLDYEEGKLTNNGKIADTVIVIEPPQPEDPEPSEPETPSEPEEEEPYLPSTPISDGVHEYSMGKMLYIDGKRVKGLYEYEDATYYFNNQGFMQTGWVLFDEGWRYFDEEGRMVTGWLKLGNVWYYLDPETGLMYAGGLATIGKSTYYFYDWGGMANDWWYQAEDGWYFFGGSGAMKTAQWVQWKGLWYYLTESGKMAADTEIGGYYVNADGVWVE